MSMTRDLRFIKDSTASEDFFGGHRRVANALVYLLRDPAVRLIALLGPWGSGKSTVVGLAEKAISESDQPGSKPHFFIFDAWLHQSDSPRRALIESLVAFVRQKEICPNISWEGDLEAIQRRSEVQEVRTTPSLTAWGFFIGLTLLFVPLGVRLADSPTVVSLGNVGFIYANIIGLFITFLPVFLISINYLSWRHTLNFFNKIFWSKANWSTHNNKNKDRTMASMFFNKAVERTTNKITKTPEPTSFEFRDIYYKIMHAIGTSGSSIVIIIDNLDRIPAEEAIAFWSTMRSLLIHDSSGDAVEFRPWVIVPLDAGAIGRIFTKSNEEGDGRAQAGAFVEKTFDAMLQVTPPVTSDWQNYLKEKLEFATSGKLSPENHHVAIKIFEASASIFRDQNATTPRKINSYVNRIVGTLLQWDDELPFYSVCYHAIFSEKLDSFSNIIGDGAPAAALMNSIADEWRQNVAAIHFGVPTAKALQILMEPEIRSAIFNEDGKRFVELSASPGFEIVLGRMIENISHPATDFDLFSAAALLDQVESDTFRNSDAWRALLELAKSATARTGNIANAAAGIRALVRRGRAPISRHILSALKAYGPEAAKAGGAAWFNEVWACDPGTDDRRDVTKGLTVPGDAGFYTQVLDAAVELDAYNKWYQLVNHLQPTTPREDIVDLVARQGSETNFDRKWYDRSIMLSRISGKWNYSAIYDAADLAIRNPKTDLDLHYAISTILINQNVAASRLSKLGSEGILADRLAVAVQLKHFGEVGILLLAFAQHFPSFDPSQQYGESATGVAILRDLPNFTSEELKVASEAMVEALLESSDEAPLLAVASVAKNSASWRPLAASVFNGLLATEFFDWHSTSGFLNAYDTLLEALGVDLTKTVMGKISIDSTFLKPFAALNDDLFFRIANSFYDKNTSKELSAKIAERFASQPKTWWLTQFQEASAAVRTLERLINHSGQFSPSPALLDATDDYVKWFIQSGPHYYLDGPINWSTLLSSMDEDQRMVLDHNIIDRIRDAPQNIASSALYNFGLEILKPGTFDREADRNVRMIILPIIIAAEETPLSDLNDTAKLLAPAVALAAKSTKAEIARIAAEKIDAELHAETIRSVLKAWDLTPAKGRKGRGKEKANNE